MTHPAHSSPLQPEISLTESETREFLKRTTRVVRKRWRELRGKGQKPAWSRLRGGPLDGAPNIDLPEIGGVVGWAYLTDRGLYVCHYRRDDPGDWRFCA